MYLKARRGLSPIIATVLLVAISLILALIIFMWARGFVSEKVEKFNEPVENACKDVSFEAEAIVEQTGKNIYISNKGNVPIYGIKVSKESFGSTEEISTSNVDPIIAGESTGDTPIEITDPNVEVEEGNSIIVTPVLVGESSRGKVTYECDSSFGKKIEVQA